MGDGGTHEEKFMSKRYTVSDGKLMLNLEEAEEGGFVVTSPLDPELLTQAETIAQAFANARDAARALKQSRARLMRDLTAGGDFTTGYTRRR
jgi:antitoxin HicB